MYLVISRSKTYSTKDENSNCDIVLTIILALHQWFHEEVLGVPPVMAFLALT